MPKNNKYETSTITTNNIGQASEEMMKAAEGTRRGFERKWYDNNFFYDGYHFRFLSRTQNKIIDLTKESEMYQGVRAIPKASRQLDGMVNLLLSNDYKPVVYPQKVDKTKYPDIPQFDQQTGQQVMMENPMLRQALEKAKLDARKVGWWLDNELGEENQDLKTKLAFMGILAGKHSISYLQIWPDSIQERIRTKVRDAFDVYLLGYETEIEDCPFVFIGTPRNLAAIKADKRFDKDQRDSINPDNKLASSEIKAAYENTRFGVEFGDDRSATVIQGEGYIKEYLNAENFKRIKKQRNAQQILEDRDYGSVVYRQVFKAGNIWLSDKYVDLKSYPLVDMRFKFGPLYQTAPIERFISSNKSMDVLASRIERYANSLPLGVIAKRQGEQYNISNIPGGQQVEYKATPPIFQTQGNLPPFLFNFMSFLDSTIQEQGLSTSTLGNLPQGVKGWQAIESLKESEYANLVMSDRMLKRTYRMIAEKFIELGDQYFVSPQSIPHEEQGETQYFNVIGANALQKRQELNIPPEEDVTPISRNSKVKIEIERGMAYTREGQKNYAKQLADYMAQLVQLGVVSPQIMIKYLEKLFELFEFGAAQDLMEELKKEQAQGMPDAQLDKMKLALAEVIKDTGIADKEGDNQEDIDKIKLALAEVIKDTDLVESIADRGDPKIEMEMAKTKQEMQHKEETHRQDMSLKERTQRAKEKQMKQEGKNESKVNKRKNK